MRQAAEFREIAMLLVALLGQIQARGAHCANEVGLPSAQAAALYKIEGGISMRELAARLACDASNVTGITDRLAARGLVERHEDGADRRVKHVRLTPAGMEVRERLEACVESGPSPLRRLSAEQRVTLRDLLRTAIDPEIMDVDESVRRGVRALGGILEP